MDYSFWQPTYPLHLYTHCIFFSRQINSAAAAAVGLCRPVKIRRQDRDQYFADGGIYFNYPVHCFDGTSSNVFVLCRLRNGFCRCLRSELIKHFAFTDKPRPMPIAGCCHLANSLDG